MCSPPSQATMKHTVALAVAIGSLNVVAGDTIVKSTYSGSSGLNDMAKAAGKYMGTAVDQDMRDSAALKVLKNSHDFGMITPANSMKWDATENIQGSFTFGSGDAVVAIAKEMGAQVRCHTLTWHSQTPQWVQSLSKQEMLSALKNHITKVMTHFGDSCYAWDVANEVMGEDGQMRNSFWYTTTGMDFLTTAFKTANEVKKSLGLKTKLYYNDYNTNTINPKSTGVLNMIKTLLDGGITVDGVGFQSHFGCADTSSAADQAANLERFTALGLDVALTEVDVTASSPSPSAEEQARQVNVYKNTVAACNQVQRCVGVTIWGYDDNYSWLPTRSPLPWYQPGGANTALVRKSLYDGIVAGWGGSSTGYPTKPNNTPDTVAPAFGASNTTQTSVRCPSPKKHKKGGVKKHGTPAPIYQQQN
ncbi:putative xylanase [Phytophthora cinnamomi]|uniref:putative xylanase n=1 Tax=Phytophthora cinnamomi TaxID=4785 RepID=UPI003559759E|nr:putative xylanase [Phytophthora cinnamomi]KAG6599635.1 putative xylanase [Phytophthora cinnamomi]